MVTFKSNDFCFTLNKSAISYILSGVSCIRDSEKSAIEEAQSNYYEKLKKMKEKADFSGFMKVDAKEVEEAKDKYMQLRLDCTIMSIVTTGGSINISVGALLHIANKLKKKDSDFHTFIAVSDFIGYIDYKLNDLDIGYVDFEDKDILAEFENFCIDKVDSRKRFITKSIVLREQSTVKLSDYLVYYVNNDGNYIQTKNNGGNTDGEES